MLHTKTPITCHSSAINQWLTSWSNSTEREREWSIALIPECITDLHAAALGSESQQKITWNTIVEKWTIQPPVAAAAAVATIWLSSGLSPRAQWMGVNLYQQGQNSGTHTRTHKTEELNLPATLRLEGNLSIRKKLHFAQNKWKRDGTRCGRTIGQSWAGRNKKWKVTVKRGYLKKITFSSDFQKTEEDCVKLSQYI